MGVLAGVLLSGIFLAGKVRQMFAVNRSLSADGKVATHRVSGPIFFGSVERFGRAFHVQETALTVMIDMTSAHLRDISSVGALDKIVAQLRREASFLDLELRSRRSEPDRPGSRFLKCQIPAGQRRKAIRSSNIDPVDPGPAWNANSL